jgi:hypothetical protein
VAPPVTRGQRRAFAAAAVLLLHGLAVWWLLRTPARQAPIGEPPRVEVRLLPLPAPFPAPRRTDAVAGKPAPTLQRRSNALSEAPRRASAITRAPPAEGPAAIAEPGTASARSEAADEAASAPPSPLDLRLRPGSTLRAGARNPAVDDPRANRARPDAGERMAATLGTDQRIVEEALGAGRRRIRQGTGCVIVSPSAAGRLDPFGQQSQRGTLPSLVEPCPR